MTRAIFRRAICTDDGNLAGVQRYVKLILVKRFDSLRLFELHAHLADRWSVRIRSVVNLRKERQFNPTVLHLLSRQPHDAPSVFEA